MKSTTSVRSVALIALLLPGLSQAAVPLPTADSSLVCTAISDPGYPVGDAPFSISFSLIDGKYQQDGTPQIQGDTPKLSITSQSDSTIVLSGKHTTGIDSNVTQTLTLNSDGTGEVIDGLKSFINEIDEPYRLSHCTLQKHD